MRWFGLTLALLLLFAVGRSLLTRLRRRSVGPTGNLANSGYQFITGAIHPFFPTLIVVIIIAIVSAVIAAIFMGNEGVKTNEIMIEPEPAFTTTNGPPVMAPEPTVSPTSSVDTTTTTTSTPRATTTAATTRATTASGG